LGQAHRNQKETAMSQQLENRVTQQVMKAYVARRWGRDHRQLVRNLKESGLYESILESVSANMVQSVNELLAGGWSLLEALDYAYKVWATAPSAASGG
jgi:predicted transcriptional regulator YheO